MSKLSPLQQARLLYHPKLPRELQDIKSLKWVKDDTHSNSHLEPEIKSLFPLTHLASHIKLQCLSKQIHNPLRVGIVLSGGQAPGGHSVIAGLFDGLKAMNQESILIGFLNGPKGIVDNHTLEITKDLLADYRNQGGFDLIGSGRTKIETEEQFNSAEKTATKLNLDGLVVVGGDDSNTNAALLAEYFAKKGSQTAVIGIPKTIDGDLKGDKIEISFGFDSASKNYAETIGSIMRDAISAKKYYYFIKLMGRSASHITLECALQTHPNIALISEEIAEEQLSLKDLISSIADVVVLRQKKGKDFGVVLIPEGVIEFIPEVKTLITELNQLLAIGTFHCKKLEHIVEEIEKIRYIEQILSKKALKTFKSLPKENQGQLLIDRDPHGNVQVSKIETERLMMQMVKKELKERAERGEYKEIFSPIAHFCGYEGRSCLPSNFDSQYCYALGWTASSLIQGKWNGYICHVQQLSKSVDHWIPGASPLTSLLNIEKRHGENKPVIKKALVNLKGKPFSSFALQRKKWEQEDDYLNPGPIQFFGPAEIADRVTLTLEMEGSNGGL